MDLSTVTVSDFKAYFLRDFPYPPVGQEANTDYVLDADITKAFAEAQVNINQALMPDDAAIRIAYLYLTAHYLCHDMQTSVSGLQSNGQFSVSSRSVGSVSESYAIPQKYMNSPILSFYTKTGYGLKYLSLVLPYMVGNVGIAQGWTTP